MPQNDYNKNNDIKYLKKHYIILPNTVQYKDDNNICQNYEMFDFINRNKPCFMNCQDCLYEN